MTPVGSGAPSARRSSCFATRSATRSTRCTPSLGFLRVRGRARDGGEYGYLIYPHRPIVAYDAETGELLSEYCVGFPDRAETAFGSRLPDADDVLAKWMSLHGDERGLISGANMHLPGRQVDPEQVRRDLRRLREWDGSLRGDRGRRLMASTTDSRPRSSGVFDGPERAAARAYMKGIGFDDDALKRPTIGIANTWIEAMPCNFHLRALAEHIKDGVRAAGGTPMEFNTVAISDGITMGTKGMKTSLVSREVIADSIELTARGYQFDALVALSACDKTIPGCVMALARLDIPSVMLYGGSIAPGRWRGKDVTILDVFEAVGAHAAGKMSDEDLHRPREPRQPGRRRLRRPVHRRTRWPARSRRWGSRRAARRWSPPRTRPRSRSPSGSASW